MRWLKKMLVAGTIMMMVVVLCACGGKNKIKGEKEIIADIESEIYRFREHDLKIDSFSIEKRQTNKDTKTDLIWVTLSASNDIYQCDASYAIEYVLYNDGWLMENAILQEEEYIGNVDAIAEENAKEALEEYAYETCQITDKVCEKNKVTFHYTASKYEYHSQKEFEGKVIYYFDLEDMWGKAFVYEKEVSCIRDIVGEWYYKDGEREFYVNVIEADYDNMKITFEYSLKNVYVGIGLKVNLKSDGVETREMNHFNMSGDEAVCTDASNYRDVIYIYTGRVRNTNSGPGSGISVNGYWLERK